MANNRMYLVHTNGERIMLAKYYPSTGWYVPNMEELAEKLRQAFNKQCFGTSEWPNAEKNEFEQMIYAKGGPEGNIDWRIEYEIK
jgi:hypothetical protein